MPEPCVVFASPTGLLKGFDLQQKTPYSICSFGAKQISTLCWDVPTDFQSVLLGTKDGFVIRQNIHNVTHSVERNSSDGAVVALLPNNQHVLSIFSDGIIKCLDTKQLDSKLVIKTPGKLCCGRTFESFVAVAGQNCNLHVWDLERTEKPIFTAKNVRPNTLQLEVPVWISDISYVPRCNGRLILTASKIGELCLYDIRCGQRRPVSRHAWRLSRKYGKLKVGKCAHGAVLPDLSVVRPITRALAFDDAPGSGVRVVAGNAIGDLCFLDMRLPRERVVSSNEDEVTSTGRVKSYGARAAEPPLGVQTLHGASGSITGLACGGASNFPVARQSATLNDENILIASSLDRFIRVYNRDSGVRLGKLYSKIPISSFVVSDNASFQNLSFISSDSGHQSDTVDKDDEAVESSESEDEEFDELWNQMDTVDDQATSVRSGIPKKAKRKRRS